MSLNLSNTALQIDGMAADLKARQSGRARRLRNALRIIRGFSLDDFNLRVKQAGADLAWDVPRVLDAPASRYVPLPPPPDFCVAAADGSHIDVDRDVPVRCFLINTGVAVLTYGSSPNARLSNRPRLYARDDELVIRDADGRREQSIEGAVLGAKRTVEEIGALVEVVRDLPKSTPALALLDGSLVMMGLVGRGYDDFVGRALIEQGLVKALGEFRGMARARPLAVAGYISLPRSAEVVSALRLMADPCHVSGADDRSERRGSGRGPCVAPQTDVEGVLDREVFAQILERGERSALFASSSPLVKNLYGDNGVDFFYVNAGEEIGRVEVPSWVAEDEAALGLAHSLVADQCLRGRGYPVGLMEAHEQAVVSGADRRLFVRMVENTLQSQALPVYSSEKSRSKRLRWL